MAGDYDVLSVKERTNALKNIRDEIDACIKANNLIQLHQNRVMTNRDVVDWLQMWDDLEQKIAIARTHATAAQSQLAELLTLDSIYPYFSLQYEWQASRGGISSIHLIGSSAVIAFFRLGGDYSLLAVPTSEVTAGDLITIENADPSNNGVYEIASVTDNTITVDSFSFTDDNSTTARIRVIRRTV